VETLRVGGGVFRIPYSPDDADSARRVEQTLERAVPVAERWAAFSVPVDVHLHASHDALEAATGVRGMPWMRAWARYGSLDLQSPRSWSYGVASDLDLQTLLEHELTHCVMYQASAGRQAGVQRRIPLWFREGMASVTAGEYRGSGYDAIWRFYRDRGATGAAGDPLASPAVLVRALSRLVYGTAHLAFQFLLDHQGEERVRRVIFRMGEGLAFAEAFEEVMGLSVAAFEDAFRRHVLAQTWRE